FRERRSRRGSISNAGQGGAQVGDAVVNLLAQIEATDRQVLHGSYALLNNLFRRSGEPIDRESSNRQERDEPVEPVKRGRCRRARGTLARCADGSRRRSGLPRRLAARSGCRLRRITERVEQASAT